MIKFNDEKIKIIGCFIIVVLLATFLKKYTFFIPIYFLFIGYILFKDNCYRDIINSFKNNGIEEGSSLEGIKRIKYEWGKRREFFKVVSTALGVFVLLVFLSDNSAISRLFLNRGERQVTSSMLSGEVEILNLKEELKIKSFEEKKLGTFMTVENDEDIPWRNISLALVNYEGESVSGLLYGETDNKDRIYLFQNIKNFNEDYKLRIFIKDKGVFQGVQEIKISDL